MLVKVLGCTGAEAHIPLFFEFIFYSLCVSCSKNIFGLQKLQEFTSYPLKKISYPD